MRASQPGRALVAALLLATLAGGACVQLAPMALTRIQSGHAAGGGPDSIPPQPAATQADAPAATLLGGFTAIETAQIRRGSIADQVVLAGRVAGRVEKPLQLSVPVRVATIAVTAGQQVEPEQLLAESDTRDLARELTAARNRLEQSSLEMEKARAGLELRLRKAVEDRDRLIAGPSATDRRSAEAAAISATAALQRAQADLNRLLAPPDPFELRAAEQEVADATAAVERAEADYARLAQGPEPAALRAAATQLDAAQNALAKAEAALYQAHRGPDPYELRAAEREVELATAELRAAESEGRGRRKSGDQPTAAQREAQLTQARLRLQGAQDRLNKLREGSGLWHLRVLERDWAIAKRGVIDADEEFSALRAGPDPLALAAASAAVNRAQATLQKSQAALAALQRGPLPDQVVAARSTLAGARVGVEAAQARLAEVESRPEAALAEAEHRIGAIQALLQSTESGPSVDPALGHGDPEIHDYLDLQRAIAQDSELIASLERDLAAGRVVAPEGGVVSAIFVKPGEIVEANRPLLALASAGSAVVKAPLPTSGVARVASGQSAQIQLEGAEEFTASARVDRIVEQAGQSVAELEVDWPARAPRLGQEARAVVTLDGREDVLLVPANAVTRSGGRAYLQVIERGQPHSVEVQIGLESGAELEVSGEIEEGQTVALSNR